ncbi:Hypothetical protein A7982_02274 [Minicystis rosea]|nr:Hypothetical protein A7982_02274 [Minicystis rosea]
MHHVARTIAWALPARRRHALSASMPVPTGASLAMLDIGATLIDT